MLPISQPARGKDIAAKDDGPIYPYDRMITIIQFGYECLVSANSKALQQSFHNQITGQITGQIAGQSIGQSIG